MLDVAFDSVGLKVTFDQALASLGSRGRLVGVGMSGEEWSLGPSMWFNLSRKEVRGHLGYRVEDIGVLARLVSTGVAAGYAAGWTALTRVPAPLARAAFDRGAGPGSPWVQGLEGAHSVPRILHAGGDATGREIQEALTARVREASASVGNGYSCSSRTICVVVSPAASRASNRS